MHITRNITVHSASNTLPDDITLHNIERFVVNTYRIKQWTKQIILTSSLHGCYSQHTSLMLRNYHPQ